MKLRSHAPNVKRASKKSARWADNVLSKKKGIDKTTYEIQQRSEIHQLVISPIDEKRIEAIKWILGERKTRKEYWMISSNIDGKPRDKSAEYIQRVIMKEELLQKEQENENDDEKYHVHHINFDKNDNRRENLAVVSAFENMRIKNDEKLLGYKEKNKEHTVTYRLFGKSRVIGEMTYWKRILVIGILDYLILGHNTRINQASIENEIDINDLKADLNILLYEIKIGELTKLSKKRFHNRYGIENELIERLFVVYEEFKSIN